MEQATSSTRKRCAFSLPELLYQKEPHFLKNFQLFEEYKIESRLLTDFIGASFPKEVAQVEANQLVRAFFYSDDFFVLEVAL